MPRALRGRNTAVPGETEEGEMGHGTQDMGGGEVGTLRAVNHLTANLIRVHSPRPFRPPPSPPQLPPPRVLAKTLKNLELG